METAIRWSQNSTSTDRRFLYVDVVGKTLSLCRVLDVSNKKIEYETVSTHTKVPSFRAFDWSPSNEGLVAVGQSSGEATVLRIDDGSQDHLSFQVKNQRYCNAVAFSSQNLLAAGLDKVRNDFCLNIWDLQQRIPQTSTHGFGPSKPNIDPVHKLASSEPITSIKFFQDDPQLLVAGVKGQFVRLYDLREPSATGSIQFPTRCVHNLAIDPCDENYIASCFPSNDTAVCIWDRRMAQRSSAAAIAYPSTGQSDMGPPEASLELKNTVAKPGLIWSLRFSRTQRRCLAQLSSTGHLKTYRIGKEFASEHEQTERANRLGTGLEARYPENIYIDQVQDIARAYKPSKDSDDGNSRIVSFDFTTIEDPPHAPNVLALARDGTVRMVVLQNSPEPVGLASIGIMHLGKSECAPLLTVNAPKVSQSPTLGQTLDQIRRRAEPKNAMRQAFKQSKLTKAEESLRRTSSHRNHAWNADLGYFEQDVNLTELLTLTSTQRLRCEAGYLFSASLNKTIVSDSHWLQSFWAWIERASKYARSGSMVHDSLDMSYLGVYAIWMDDLGTSSPKTRSIGPSSPKMSHAIEGLAHKLDLPAGKGCPTAYSEYRQLCLHVSSLAWTLEELQGIVKRLVAKNQHTKAAALAMFADERKLAYSALRHKSSTQAHKMLAMAIAGSAKRGLLSSAEDSEADEDWSETIGALSEELTDPYARAILALVRTGSYEAVVEEESLPLKYRIGVALRWFSDRVLTTYIAATTKEVVANGDVEGVILTGIGSPQAVDLMGNYIRKFGDLQTAVLSLSATVPRYINEPATVRRFSNWRETYRHQINSWGLKFDRVRFDIGYQKLATDRSGRRLIEPAKPQVALVCGFCSQSLAQFDGQEEAEAGDQLKTQRTPKHPLTNDKAAAIGTVCPKCGRHLPRCGVCDMWLGVPDSSHMRWYKSVEVDLSASVAGSVNTTLGPGVGPSRLSGIIPKGLASSILVPDAVKDTLDVSEAKQTWEEALKRFTVFCIKCSHGFHGNHARQWFGGSAGREGHRVCPVSTCGSHGNPAQSSQQISPTPPSDIGDVLDVHGTTMSTADLFHAQIARLKPSDQIKPNTLWVAILKHNKLPTDDLTQTDFLWVKYGKNRDMTRIRKAYLDIERVEDVVLRHAFKTIEDTVLVRTLNTQSDEIVALEAILPSQLAARTMKEERSPLQHITNHAPVGRLTAKHVKSEVREDSLAIPTTSIVRACTNSMPAVLVPPQKPDLAWIDFTCERRELLQRVQPRESPQAIVEMNHRISMEWAGYTELQIDFYVARAKRIATTKMVPSPGDSFTETFTATARGFWTFYYDRYYIQKRFGINHHITYESTQKYFSTMLTAWTETAPAKQHVWISVNRPFMIANTIPPVPIAVRPIERNQWAHSTRDMEERSGFNHGSGSGLASSRSKSLEPGTDNDLSDPNDESWDTKDDEAEHSASTRMNIPSLFATCTPEQLEKGVEKGVTILDRLRTIMTGQQAVKDSEQWLQTIENVQRQAVRTRTIIGVVGNTGAGKSSIVNALLDEERLLPTNCMRACTAVITEISYNYDSSSYLAQIEFIAAKDWQAELETLFKDLLDGNGNVSRDCANEDSEAGIAYAKIKAVYPKLTKEDISDSSVEALMKHRNVSGLLGSSRSIEETECPTFYRKLQSFVDSKEKTTKSEKDKSEKEKSKPREMEFWPLIKVVRLYVRAPALSTGAVIVDLPGVHDSNQARAAVAQGYMKQCSGLWICAPINRAVDDKAAKSLLGETFKRQLKMDGGYNSVTFICSKTDDISLTEAQDSLGIDEELSPLWEQCDELANKKKSLKKELDGLKETRGDFTAAMESADEELDTWDKLKDDLEDGKTVFSPSTGKKSTEKKRKRGVVGRPSTRKKPRIDDSDDDFLDDSSDRDGNEESVDASGSESEQEETCQPLTEEQVLTKIADLRAAKKDGRQQRTQLDNEIKRVRSQILKAEKDVDAAEAIISHKCIQGRNEYSKGAIQQDFAAGIKELDQEIQEEEDVANFNPDLDVRDYDEVARSLPVFTVSSRAYQKLKGRLVKDKDVPGFEDVEETFIPQLQEHARKTTEAGREASCRRFLNSISQLLNSLRLWASSDGSTSNLTEMQKSQEAKILKDKLNQLDKDLELSIQSICAALIDELQEHVLDQFSAAVRQATTEACSTAEKWGQKVNHDDRSSGGLYWSTYKALCRRQGVYSNALGLHDWNTQLTEPIIKNIASGWERAFSRRMPSVLNGLSNKSGTLLTAFHKSIEMRATRNGTSLASLEMLKQQLPSYKDTFKDLSVTAQTQITTRQKDINREFVPVVAEAMLQVYDDCESERGPGQYLRMKALMSRHVDGVRHQMFNDSTNAVKNSSKKLVKDIEDFLLGKANEVFISVKRDYESVVLGRRADAAHQLPREQRQIRSDVNDIVEGTELIFKKVVGLEPATPEPEPLQDEGLVETVCDDETKFDVKEEIETNEDVSMASNDTGVKKIAEEDQDSVMVGTGAINESGSESEKGNAQEETEASTENDVKDTTDEGNDQVIVGTSTDFNDGNGQGSETSASSNSMTLRDEGDDQDATTRSVQSPRLANSPGQARTTIQVLHESVHTCSDDAEYKVRAEDLQGNLEEPTTPDVNEHDRRSSSVASWVQSWFSA